jgi:hypothetical protein
MLKGCVVAGGLMLVVAGIVFLAFAHMLNPAVLLLLAGMVIVLGMVFERRRYKPILDASPGPEWQATDERFVDERSGALVVVHYNPRTGQRAYVRAAKTTQ